MTKADRELIRTHGVALGAQPGEAALERMDLFLGVLGLWNRTTRLTGEREPSDIIRKHVIDSLAPAPYLPPEGVCVDVGSGAGFPGIVLACLRPDLEFVLLEPRQRRASFLRAVAREAGLSGVTVLPMRAEQAAAVAPHRERADLVISRALRLERFLPAAALLVRTSGFVMAMQTPSTDRDHAASVGQAQGLSFAGERDYQLPRGERRRLLLFRR